MIPHLFQLNSMIVQIKKYLIFELKNIVVRKRWVYFSIL